jgi:LuxR family maltose regulon positive regulatory protein
MHWIGKLPDQMVRDRPLLCFASAWTLVWQSRSLEPIESLLRDASRGDERVTARVTALRGMLAGFRGQVSVAAELSRRALEQLPADDQLMRPVATWILSATQLDGSADNQVLESVLSVSQQAGNVMLSYTIECGRAELLMRQGQLCQAEAVYRHALEMVTDARGNRLPIAGSALVGLGELARERGDLDAARQYLEESIRLSEQWTEIGALDAYVSLARVRWARGKMESARAALNKAQELAALYDLTELDDLTVAMFQAWLNVVQGDQAAVQRWAEARGLLQYLDVPLQEAPGDSYDHRMHKYELLVLARSLIAEERFAEALALCQSVTPLAERRQRQGLLIESYALQALAWRAQGEAEKALSALEHALTLAEPEGYTRIFMDEGEPMRSLIAELSSGPGVPGSPAYACAERLLTSWPSARAPHPASGTSPQPDGRTVTSVTRDVPLIDPLTGRELEVLQLLRTPLSLPEIADRLVISINTVRSHAKHIYAKLDVHSRADALERAEKLGLL